MIIGAMNHPARDPIREIEWMGRLGLEFVDLTLEPPAVPSWCANTKEIKNALTMHHLHVVGHTAFYLPLASAMEELRQGALAELRRCVDRFAELGTAWMNVHPDPHRHFYSREQTVEANRETLAELIEYARPKGVGIMLENIPGSFNSVEQLAPLLEALPELGLHLDIGHANLMVTENTTEELLAHFGPRIRHVHLHDNKGGTADLHLPLGSGTMDFRRQLAALKSIGYDGTITLEVFSADPHYFAYSRDVLRETWDAL